MSEGELTEFILEKMIARKVTITKFTAVSARRTPSKSLRILTNPRNRISRSTTSRIFNTVRGVQCVQRLAYVRTCTAKCWIKETSR